MSTHRNPPSRGGETGMSPPSAKMAKPCSAADGEAEAHGLRRVVFLFWAWKGLLLAVACASPGPGYDTSTQLVLGRSAAATSDSWYARIVTRLVERLMRWDAIYFATSSERGHLYEQDWAFSWLLARCNAVVARALFFPLSSLSPIVKSAAAGIVVSHVSHLLAVITLFHLTSHLIPGTDSTKRKTAFTAACLHILSPAGLFLSAPYGESTFALFNFLGTLSYTYATRARLTDNPTAFALYTLTAGLTFGLASTIRSNGLFSGLPFAWDALAHLNTILHESRYGLTTTLRSPKALLTLLTTLLAGTTLALFFAFPQTLAYLEYCTTGPLSNLTRTPTRPWCTHTPPIIYTYVQTHYWHVGPLAYWTPNNIPLFLLATPTLALLLYTAALALRPTTLLGPKNRTDVDAALAHHVFPRLALPQALLALLALTSFHVQIVNRVASGYAGVFVVVALAVQRVGEGDRWVGMLGGRMLEWIVRGGVVYAIVQGGLYAAFLPPA